MPVCDRRIDGQDCRFVGQDNELQDGEPEGLVLRPMQTAQPIKNRHGMVFPATAAFLHENPLLHDYTILFAPYPGYMYGNGQVSDIGHLPF